VVTENHCSDTGSVGENEGAFEGLDGDEKWVVVDEGLVYWIFL